MKKSLVFFNTIFFSVYFSVLFLLPVLALFFTVFKTFYIEDFFTPSLFSILTHTLRQSILSTFFSILIALPLGQFLFKKTKKTLLLKAIEYALLIPYTLPTLLIALSFIAFLGETSFIKNTMSAVFGFQNPLLYSESSVIFAHTMIFAPWLALQWIHCQKSIPHGELEAMRLFTNSPWFHFKTIYWPRFKWSFYASTLQVFQACTFSFIIVLLLGGGPPVQTIETALYSELRRNGFDTTPLLPLSFWGILFSLIPWLVLLFLERKNPQIAHHSIHLNAFTAEEKKLQFKSSPHSKKYLIETTFVLIFVTLFLLPYLSLVSPIFEVSSLKELLNPVKSSHFFQALKISFSLALTQSLITCCMVFSFLTLYKFSPKKWGRSLWVLSQLPSSLSPLVLGFAFILFYGQTFQFFEKSFMVIVFLQSILFFPFAIRFLWPHFQLKQKKLLEVAQLLGASPLRTFLTVEWPRLKKPILITFLTLFCFSLGEVSSVLLFYNEDLIPLTVLISRSMGQYRFFEAQVYSLALLFLIGLFFLFMYLMEFNERP